MTSDTTKTARRIEDLPEWFNAASDLIDHNLVAGRGDKTALVDCWGSLTYSEIGDRIDRMAGLFAAFGIHREQRVLLCLLDTRDFPTVFLGAIKAGVVPVPINTLLTPDDYHWLLENSGAVAVFVSGEIAPQWSAIAEARPDVRFISSGGGPWTDLAAALVRAKPVRQCADTHRDDVAFWLYTSGSTGRPKGAMHAQSSLRLTANLFGLGLVGYREDDVVLSVAKLFFAYGLGNALTFVFAAGATVVLHDGRPTPAAITELVEAHGVSMLAGVPSFFAGWFASGNAPSRDAAARLRIALSAGEALPAHVGEQFRRLYGADIIDGLGSTELLHVYLSQRPGAVRNGCTGRPVPGYQVRLVADGGHLCGPGQPGELQVKGPTVAQGYWRNRPKSIATFGDGWTRTGDICTVDEDGWYNHCGRGDDMLKVGGIYVSPAEVEEALLMHEAVLEAAVVGAADSDGLIKPRGHVVLRPGFCASPELERALQSHVKARLAPYKYPRSIIFTDALPKTATGKIQRYRLRQL